MQSRISFWRWLAILLVVSATSCSDGPPVSPPGGHCGGNTSSAPICPLGYTCAATTDGGPPVGDVGGVCRKNGT